MAEYWKDGPNKPRKPSKTAGDTGDIARADHPGYMFIRDARE